MQRSPKHDQTHSSEEQKLMSDLILEFNNDFIHHGTSFCLHKNTFFKCKITTITVGNVDNSQCKCDQGKAILDEVRTSKILYKDICIKEHKL